MTEWLDTGELAGAHQFGELPQDGLVEGFSIGEHCLESAESTCRVAVNPLGSHSVEDIGNSNYLAVDVNIVKTQTAWVTGFVLPFVMLSYGQV